METIALESPRIEPPVDLSPEEATTWRAIVQAMAPGWFDSGNAPVLAELVRHIELSKQLAKELRTMRATTLTAPTAKGAKQRAAFAELVAQQREESKTIASLSVKLRLTNSSHRRDEKYDDRLKHVQSSAPRPWERRPS
jgi:hypothetical protein